MGDYVKAMQYHKHDLTLARTMGDRLGEAKASGNLGNTLKVMGKFEEAVICCRRHLEICQEHRDRVGEGRALYNLGNVYHAKVSLRVMLILKMISKQFWKRRRPSWRSSDIVRRNLMFGKSDFNFTTSKDTAIE